MKLCFTHQETSASKCAAALNTDISCRLPDCRNHSVIYNFHQTPDEHFHRETLQQLRHSSHPLELLWSVIDAHYKVICSQRRGVS